MVNSILGMMAGVFMLLVNVLLQLLLLLFTKFYIVDPSQGEMSLNQIGFAQKYGGVWNMEVMQEALANHDETAKTMCEMPTTDSRFLYIILLCWVVVVMKDLRSSLEFAITIAGLPNTAVGEELIDEDDHTEGTVIASVTWPVRLAVVVLVAVPKFVIGLLLLHYGCLWLMATSGFMDLVLNAVALAFIVEFSTLLFATFLSASMQGKVTGTQFKYVPSGGTSSWVSILVKAWDSHMSCIMMLGLSLGIVYYYIHFQMHGRDTPFPANESSTAGQHSIENFNIANQINIPCQKLIGNWWTTHDTAGAAYPWYNQYLKDLNDGGSQSKKGRGKKTTKTKTDGAVNDAMRPDRKEATATESPVARAQPDKMKEVDAIQDSIENPQKLLPDGMGGEQLPDDMSATFPAEAVPSSKLTAEPMALGPPLAPNARSPEDSRLQRAAAGTSLSVVAEVAVAQYARSRHLRTARSHA